MLEVTQTTELMLIGLAALLMSVLIIARSHMRKAEEDEASTAAGRREPR